MFKRYNSIENSYQGKYINRWLDKQPELKTETYIVTEKIDGANIQIYFEPGTEYKVGKRSSFIEKDSNFYDIGTILPEFEEQFKKIQDNVNITNRAVRIYGELYGQGVQKRVNYMDKKSLIFFDVEVHGELHAPRDAMAYLDMFNLPKVPIIAIKKGIVEALEVNETFNTLINPIEGNVSEGLVVRPFHKNFYNVDELFILKKKSEAFSEKEIKKGKVKTFDEGTFKYNQLFRDYITENRMLSVFSKHGPIKETKQLGEYIKLILEDAKEDFNKDHDVSQFDPKDQKTIYNVGDSIVKLLKKQLGG
jgi:Rnl2 family RNA ligase